MRILRRTREQHRHEIATVRQQVLADATPPDDWKRQREIECERMDAARRGKKAGR